MSCSVLMLGGPGGALLAHFWRACSVLCLLVVVVAVAAPVPHHVLLLCPVFWEVAGTRGGDGPSQDPRSWAVPPHCCYSRLLFGELSAAVMVHCFVGDLRVLLRMSGAEMAWFFQFDGPGERADSFQLLQDCLGDMSIVLPKVE